MNRNDGVTKGGTMKISTAKAGAINISAILPLALVLALTTFVDARDAIFIGLTDAKGEPVHAGVEQAIRHELSASAKFRLIGETETQRAVREIERLGHRRTEAAIPPSARLADSTIIIRGIVEELTLTPKRRMLLWGKIDAQLTIKLRFNEIAGPASYEGQFSGGASKEKGFLLFADPKKVIHISAIDRSELMGKMQSAVVKETSKFADLYFGALATGPIHRKEAVEVDSAVVDETFPGMPELMTEE